jgi:hypothetical protein
LILLQELKQQGRSWEHFLFWEGFETQNQTANEQMAGSKKKASPQISARRRRAIPVPLEDKVSGVKSHSWKRKLNFEQTTEQSIQQDSGHPTQQSIGKNILNLPYSDSESEHKDQCPANKGSEKSTECAQNYETVKHTEQGESSKTQIK